MKTSDILSHFLVCGHRGFAAEYPENTMISFEKAIETGVDMIEMDIAVTRERKLVLCHDVTLDRTSDGHGKVIDYTCDELMSFNMAAHFTKRAVPFQRIPFFEDVLQLAVCFPNLLLNVDLKHFGADIADAAMDLVEKYHLKDRTLFNGLNGLALARTHARGYFTEGAPANKYTMENFDALRTPSGNVLSSIAISGPYDVSPEYVEKIKREYNVAVWAWGTDTAELSKYAIDSGITLAVCNDPRPCMEVARALGLRP